MTEDNYIEGEITDEDEFATALQETLEKAVLAGVDIRGAWQCQTGGSTHNWEIEIIELARDADD